MLFSVQSEKFLLKLPDAHQSYFDLLDELVAWEGVPFELVPLCAWAEHAKAAVTAAAVRSRACIDLAPS